MPAGKLDRTSPSVVRHIVGQRVRDARMGLGLTQQEVADYLGLHRLAVLRIESGERDTSVRELAILAAKLRFSVDALLGQVTR